MTLKRELRSSTAIVLGFDTDPAPAGGGDPAPAADAGGSSLLTEADPAPAADPAPEGGADPAPEGEQGAEKEGEEGGADPAPEGEEEGNDGPPEEYADFEVGENTILDDEALAEFKGMAKELGLKQEQAQQMVSMAEKLSQKWAEGLQNHIVETRTAWRDTVKTDKELGGDALPENLATAKSAIEAFGTPELKKMLDDTGVGDNPEFIRFALRVGKANREHDFVKSGKPAGEVPFYDHPTSRKGK